MSSNENSIESLETYGLASYYPPSGIAHEGLTLGRIINRQAMRYELITEHGRLWAEVSGRLNYTATNESELPVVGDWVKAFWDNPAIHDSIGLIMEVCPRSSVLMRQAPGTVGTSQALAANVQYLLIVWPLDKIESEKTKHIPSGHQSYLRWGMIQRFMTAAISGAIQAILVFTKADLVSAKIQEDVRSQALQHWPDCPALFLGQDNSGLDQHQDLLALLPKASTAVLVGLSGAGKSTLLNQLDEQIDAKVQALSHVVNKGRHTTTHRELYRLSSGTLIIDSPGIRELGLLATQSDLNQSFSTLSKIALMCRFANCSHHDEPGCAVHAAILDGSLEQASLEQYVKQQAEIARLASRQLKTSIKSGQKLSAKEYKEASSEQQKWKKISKLQKQAYREREKF